jgi:RNA polymerase primary sigma factor
MTVLGTRERRVYPRALTHEKTQARLREYAARVREHGPDSPAAIEVRNRIVEGNLGLVFQTWKARGRRVPHDDVLGTGTQGLITAVERFDVSRGLRFSTYATHWIRHALGRTFANEGNTIRVPVHAQGPASDAKAECRDAAEAARRMRSLDTPIVEGSRETYADMTEDHDALAPFDAVDDGRQAAQLARAVAALPDEHRQVIALRGEGLTLAEVATKLGTTRELVRRLESEALARLRRALRDAA